MNFKVLTKIFVLIIIAISLFTNPSYSADITEAYPLPFLGFVNYQVIDSNWDGDTLTRTIQIKVRNTSDMVLSNLKLTIDALPDYVTVSSTETTLGDLNPGSTGNSRDTFTISVDTSKQSQDGIRIIWQVECDSDGKHLFDETAVIEHL